MANHDNHESTGELIRARTWDDYVGQEKLKERLRISIQSAINSSKMLPHMLLTASPGMGKTTLARIIADEVGDPFHAFKMPIKEETLIDFIEQWEGGVLLLDEIHAAPKSMQELLLTALEDGYIQRPSGYLMTTRHITFLAATTEPERVIKPLWDRFWLKPRFAPYTDQEMSRVIAGMAERAGVQISKKTLAGLGRAAGGTPRVAGSLVVAAQDLAAIHREINIDSVLDLAGIDHDGLTDRHIDYLQCVKDLGGLTGINNIKSLMQLSLRVIEDLERLLIIRGFIQLTPRGRMLMPKAYAKLPIPVAPEVADRRRLRAS